MSGSIYHPIYPEIVSREEIEGALFIDCDDDAPQIDDPMISLADPDDSDNRAYFKKHGQWPVTNYRRNAKKLLRTPRGPYIK